MLLKADCPSCKTKIMLGAQPKMGQRFTCSGCRVELEVAWLDPLELDFPFSEDEFEDDESEEDVYD